MAVPVAVPVAVAVAVAVAVGRVFRASKRQPLTPTISFCGGFCVCLCVCSLFLQGGRVGGKQTADQGAHLEGAYIVFRASDLVASHQARDARAWISDVKFSPDGQTLAVGSHDKKVYLYNTVDFSAKAKCRKSTSAINHLDFSADSVFLQTNDSSYELLFYDAETGVQQVSATAMKDVEWHTWTCTLGWPVQGIWPPFADGTDINSVDRSHNNLVVATADDFGQVKLLRNPCVEQKACFNQYRGHSSHVTNVRWLVEDSHLVSVGGNDKCVMQWRADWPDPDEGVRDATVDLDTDDEFELKRDGKDIDRTDAHEAAVSMDFGALFEMEANGGGDEFTAVKPWTGAVVEPTEPPAVNPSVPDEELVLEWVHGYRAADSRNNLRYTEKGELVYPAAALGVVFSTHKWHQRCVFMFVVWLCLAVFVCSAFVCVGWRGCMRGAFLLPAWSRLTVVVGCRRALPCRQLPPLPHRRRHLFGHPPRRCPRRDG